MSYENPDTITYQFSANTFGATAVTSSIVGPKGKVGFVRDIEVDITTSLVGSTTVPEIMVGISSGDSLYGRYRLGSAAGTAYGVGLKRASQEATVVGNPPRASNKFTGHVVLDGGPLATSDSSTQKKNATPLGRIPANTTAIVTMQAGTGGSPAGGGTVRVTIQWVGNAGGMP